MTVIDLRDHLTDIQVEVATLARPVRMAVFGDLDAATATGFALAGQDALTGRSHTTLTIDMSQVTFIDAAGVGALVEIHSHAQLEHNVVVVTDPSPCVARLLDLTAVLLPSSPRGKAHTAATPDKDAGRPGQSQPVQTV